MTILQKDYRGLLDLVDILYSIPDRAQMLRVVCEELQKLVPVSSAIFMPIEPNTANFKTEGHFAFNCSSEPVFQFANYYSQLHPLVTQGFLLAKINQAIRITDVISPTALRESEYGRDFQPLTPLFYEMCITMGSQGDGVGILGLHRPKEERDFTKRENEILNLLIPHISHAIRNIELMREATAFNGIGVISWSAGGQLAGMNEEAKRALNGRTPDCVPVPTIGHNPVFFRSETGLYRVRSVQMNGRNNRTLYLEPQFATHDLHSRMTLLGLTKRQLEVATLVIHGLSNREIAEHLHIAEQTVKDHLRDVFDKMHVRRRSELIAKVLGTAAY